MGKIKFLSLLVGCVLSAIIYAAFSLLHNQAPKMGQLACVEGHELEVSSLETITSHSDSPMNIMESTPKQGEVTENRNLESEVHEYRSLTVSQLIFSDLSESDSEQLFELSSIETAQLLNSDSDARQQTINKLTLLEGSEQRDFLLRAVFDADETTRSFAANQMSSSNRVLDRQDSIALAMTLAKSDRDLHLQRFFQTEQNSDVLNYGLGYLNKPENIEILEKYSKEILYIADFSSDAASKAMAIKLLMLTQPHSPTVNNGVAMLLASTNQEEVMAGLDLLQLQLNDYGVQPSPLKKADIESYLRQLASDESQEIEIRIRALEGILSL